MTSAVSPGSVWDLVVPPHSGFPDLLFQLQSAELLLPALLAVPQLLAVLVHVHARPLFEAAARKLPQVQPGLPVTRQRRRNVGLVGKNLVLLEVVAWVQKVSGDDVHAVTGQGSAEGVLVAGAGEHT